jgi:hypothetical protein
MGIGYWPFCIAANADADYALIAAPDFLIQAGELDFFRTRSFELTEPSSEPKVVPLEFAALGGPFLCGYYAAPSELNGESLIDQAGRILYHAVGFIAVSEGLAKHDTVEILRACVDPMHAVLRRFLATGSSFAAPLTTIRAEYPNADPELEE